MSVWTNDTWYEQCGHNSLYICAKLATVSCLFYPCHSDISTVMKKLGLAWKLIFSIACCMFTERNIWVLAAEEMNSSLNMAVPSSSSYWWRPSFKIQLKHHFCDVWNVVKYWHCFMAWCFNLAGWGISNNCSRSYLQFAVQNENVNNEEFTSCCVIQLWHNYRISAHPFIPVVSL